MRIGHILGSAFLILVAAGCSSTTEDESAQTTGDALSDQPSQPAPDGKTPIVWQLEPPPAALKINLDTDWSQARVDVLDRIDDTPAWIKAEKDGDTSFVSTIADQVQNGLGDGNCRLSVGLKKAMVHCSWHF